MEQKFYYVDPFDTEGLIPDMNKQKDDNENHQVGKDDRGIYAEVPS